MAGVWIFTAVFVLYSCSIFGENINIALKKPAYQRTTYTGDYPANWSASNAVDGILYGHIQGYNLYTHTKDEGSGPQWWIVDLSEEFIISKMIIYARKGREDRADVSLYVGSDHSIKSQLKEKHEFTFTAPMWREVARLEKKLIQTAWINPGEKAKFVAVTQNGFINLAEVEVFQQPPDTNPNLALDKPAYQITTYCTERAGMAVDGSFTSFTSTNSGTSRQWWIVDLQKPHTLSEIYVRVRNHADRCNGSAVYVSNVKPNTTENNVIDFNSGGWYKVKELKNKFEHTLIMETSQLAQYVAVVRDGIISLVEVQVYPLPFKNSNIAFGKPAYQISTLYEKDDNGNKYIWSASRAVDGFLYDKDDRAYAHTNGPASAKQWWMVDLKHVHQITEIYLHGRSSQYNRSKDIKIYLGKDDERITPKEGTQIHMTDSSLWEEVASFGEGFGFLGIVHLDQPKQARYVAIRNEREDIVINLKEVQIYQKARDDLSAKGLSTCCEPNSLLSKYSSTVPCMISAGQFWEITFNNPILFELARVTVEKPSNLESLKYMYSPAIQEPLKTCRGGYGGKDQRLLSPVVCKHNKTPIMKKFRIEFFEGSRVTLTGVQIYATDKHPFGCKVHRRVTMQAALNFPWSDIICCVETHAEVQEEITSSLLSADYEELEIYVDPLEQIPYVYNANLDEQCKYKISGHTIDAGKIPGTPNNIFSISNLSPGTDYTFNLTCHIGGIQLPGLSKVITAQTKACRNPAFQFGEDDIRFERVNFTSSGLQYWKARISIKKITDNCTPTSSVKFSKNGSPQQESDVFNNLTALTTYNFTVQVTNRRGKITTKTCVKKTSELVPGKPSISSADALNTTCIELTWGAVSSENGDITKYQYNCNTSISSWKDTSTIISHKVCDLLVGKYVGCRIRAFTSAGHGPASNLKGTRTMCGTPSLPVFNTTSDTYKDKTGKQKVKLKVIVTQKSAVKSNCDGGVTYAFKVSQNIKDTPHKSFDSLGGNGQPVFDNLYPYTNTCVTVEVSNTETYNSFHTVCKRTSPAVPDEKPAIESQNTTEECISFKFKHPDKFNAANASYKSKVLCTDQPPTYTSYNKVARICGLKSATKYDCNITVMNKVGDGPTVQMTDYTGVIFSTVNNITQLELTEARNHPSILVKLYPVNVPNKNVSSYLVIAQRQASTGQRRKRTAAAPCNISQLEKLKNSTANLKISPRDCYIAAWFNDIPMVGVEFYLGDGKVYGNYTNHPVTEGEEYLVQPVFILKYADDFTKVIESAPSIIGKAVKVTEPTDPTTSDNPNSGTPLELIIAPVMITVAVAVFVILLVIFLRRRRKDAAKSKPNEQLELNTTNVVSAESSRRQGALQPPAKKPVVPVRPLSMKGEEYKLYENNNRHLRSNCIDPPSLASFIQNEANKIDEQFQALDNMPLPNRSVALLPINDGKSRYKELYPGDEYRVKLSRNDRGTDYINASHIEGYKKYPGYIAAMGPTEKTVDDFWLMLWEQNPSGIVMVTKVVEITRMKCYQYWPDNMNTPMSFGEISVRVTNCEEWADYTVRTFQCTKGDEIRNIKHFYFLSWPDHGVPKDTGGYLSFYNRIQTSIARLTTPLVVHCSAGVGRTGTFIAMDYLVKQASDENRLQFYESVEKMRMRRPRMIQTVEQYRFLYIVVCEFLSTKDFTYSPDRLASLIREFDEEEASNMRREYKLLQRRVDSVQLQYSKAKLSVNREKNRFAECLAADGHRVYINGSGSSDYINAVFMDTYKEKNHWIATQLPLKNSVEDFWTMVVEQDVKVIAQLENFKEEEAFFPSEGDNYELVFGKFTIARLDNDQTGDVADVIALKVSTKQAERTVSVVVASKVWDGQSEQNASDLIKLHDLIEKLEQKSGNGTTIITCLNGASRCGLMICVYNALDKLKLEQQVDVYCPVLKARLRRPQFLPNIAQYALIYEALKEYVEQFSDYGNFQ